MFFFDRQWHKQWRRRLILLMFLRNNRYAWDIRCGGFFGFLILSSFLVCLMTQFIFLLEFLQRWSELSKWTLLNWCIRWRFECKILRSNTWLDNYSSSVQRFWTWKSWKRRYCRSRKLIARTDLTCYSTSSSGLFSDWCAWNGIWVMSQQWCIWRSTWMESLLAWSSLCN